VAGVNTAAVHIDGGCRPTNPGHAGFAVVIDLDGQEFVLSRYIGWATNNVAEFTALIVAVKYASHLGAEALEVVSDSQLVVEQTHGRWRLRSADLKPLVMEARDLLFRHFPHRWELTWTARDKNVKADYYCGLAIQAGRFQNPWLRKHLKDKSPGKIIDPFRT
jgi:ribonuclease H / adenosylcobalamin/alpha-ribazole phosphatase